MVVNLESYGCESMYILAKGVYVNISMRMEKKSPIEISEAEVIDLGDGEFEFKIKYYVLKKNNEKRKRLRRNGSRIDSKNSSNVKRYSSDS